MPGQHNGRIKRTRPSLANIRSAITNGSAVIANTDHRSAWMRRLRDLQQLHLSDAGGEDANISEASMLELQLEMLDAKFAANNGEATPAQLQIYQSACNTLRRTLEAISGGLERRARDVTPSLGQLLREDQDRQRRQQP